LNPIQFNALAIVFILVMMPFAIAFITNAGSSSDGEYEDSIAYPRSPFPNIFSYWIDNGGDNYTQFYENANANQPFTALTYIDNSDCPTNVSLAPPCFTFPGSSTLVGGTPMTSLSIPKSHYYATTSYVGSSGDGPFAWSLNSQFLYLVQDGEAIDKLRLTFVDQDVDYNCDAAIFENISFDGRLKFVKGWLGTDSISFDDFTFETSNQYRYTARQTQHGFVEVCQVGFQIVFDLTGFETLNLDAWVKDDWINVSMEVHLDNFERTDDTLPFADTALPFAGDGEFLLGVEHQPINPVNAGFIIKTGTLLLALVTFVIAIASTPYWDPFRNLVKGALD
jgi:hypothetical protein